MFSDYPGVGREQVVSIWVDCPNPDAAGIWMWDHAGNSTSYTFIETMHLPVD